MCRLRAVVILPVRDLASQVFKVFETYCQGTHLNVGIDKSYRMLDAVM